MNLDIFRHFDALYPVSNNCKYHLQQRFTVNFLTKGDCLLRAGTVCTNLSFVQNGLLMGYVPQKRDKICCRFASSGDICIVPHSYFLQQPSQETIRAVEDSVVYSLARNDVESVYQQFPEFRVLTGLYFSKAHIEAEDCLFIMRSLKPLERYEWLITHFEKYGDRISGKSWASFLGVRPETLSKYKHQNKKPDSDL